MCHFVTFAIWGAVSGLYHWKFDFPMSPIDEKYVFRIYVSFFSLSCLASAESVEIKLLQVGRSWSPYLPVNRHLSSGSRSRAGRTGLRVGWKSQAHRRRAVVRRQVPLHLHVAWGWLGTGRWTPGCQGRRLAAFTKEFTPQVLAMNLD